MELEILVANLQKLTDLSIFFEESLVMSEVTRRRWQAYHVRPDNDSDRSTCAQLERENIKFRLNSGLKTYVAKGGKSPLPHPPQPSLPPSIEVVAIAQNK